jgi:hypothetical protein
VTALTWPRLREEIEAGRLDLVAELVVGATDEQRRVVTPQLEAYVKQVPVQAWVGTTPSTSPAAWVALAAIGCLPSAARVAALLGRPFIRDLWYGVPAADVIRIARARGLPWLGDLATRLATKLSPRSWQAGSQWRLVAALVREAGVAPPSGDRFVQGWVTHVIESHLVAKSASLLDFLRDDPFLPWFVPRLFEVDGVGRDLCRSGGWDPTAGTWDQEPRFPKALAALAEQGRLERPMLLDGCLGRFLRGDRPAALRAFVLLHEALVPTTDELSERAADYARLLADAPSTVATLAQRALRTVDDAGRLELETLLEAADATLRRSEKHLVKAQLGRLDEIARRRPDRSAEVLQVVAVAFDHPAHDLQEQALTLVARHAGMLDTAARERIAGAATRLAADLRDRAQDLLGITPATGPAKPPAGAWPLPGPAPAAQPMPPPIASPAELAEEVVALRHGETSAPAWERLLAGLVEWRARAPHDLAAALAPVRERFLEDRFAPSMRWIATLAPAIDVAVGTPSGGVMLRLLESIRLGRSGDLPAHRRGPRAVIAMRASELAVELQRRPVPALVATPTSTTGELAPDVLVGRLEAAERAGWQPWTFDLEQALLRLPREVDAGVLPRVVALHSPAGVRLAQWLHTGGLPDPQPRRVEDRRGDHHRAGPGPARRIAVALSPPTPAARSTDASPGVLAGLLSKLDPALGPGLARVDPDLALWPSMLPHHRDVTAAWALPALASLADCDARGGGTLLPLLAEVRGPVGPAMTLGLAYVLGARDQADRVAALDAFLALTATGDLDAAALGRELGGLTADAMVKLGRVTASLGEAARAGAQAAAWEVVAGMLPALLGGPTHRPSARGLPDLLALGAQLAADLARRGTIPELAATAARGGSSRVVTEARRLDGILAGRRSARQGG